MNRASRPVSAKSHQVHEIQFLRGLAIVFIMVVHAAGDLSHVEVIDTQVALRMLFHALTSFGVPLFVLISGFVLYHRYGADVPLRDFYFRRFGKVLVPYAAFSVIYLGYAGLENGWFPSPGKCLWKLLTGTSYYHLWFIRLIAQVYLLYPVLAKFYRHFERRGMARRLLLGALVFQTFANIGRHVMKELLPNAEILDFVLTFTRYIFYFLLGMWVSRNRQKLSAAIDRSVKRYALPAVPLYALLIFLHVQVLLSGIERHGSTSAIPDIDRIPIVFVRIVTQIISLIVSYKAVRFLMQRPGVWSAVILRIGMLSFGFYLLHPLMLSIVIRMLEQWFSLGLRNILSFPLNFILTAVSTYGVISFINRTPFSELLLGKARRE